MKIDVKENKTKKDTKYPCLMIADNGSIMLMKKAGHGVLLVNGGECISVGDYGTGWNMSMLKPFNGTITLSND